MKIHSVQSRPNYIATQVKRSQQKFGYCKVSARDPLVYYRIIQKHQPLDATGPLGPVLCLGVRNGREVDLFRTALISRQRAKSIAATELKIRGLLSPLDFLAAGGRSDFTNINSTSVLGVEVNPEAERQDIWIGSFDDMPSAWANQFGVVYSNSFDQAQNPHRTAKEWLRVTKPGGFLIIAFGVHKEPTATDPVGGLSLPDILKLFPGELVYYNAAGTLYAEVIIQKVS